MDLTRRAVLTGALGVLAASRADADGRCAPWTPNGLRQCQVGLNIGPVPTARQACQNWCWAACVEAIFNWHGYDVCQRDIVRRVYPDLGCRTATGPQIARAISGEWQDSHGRWFAATADVMADLSFGIVQPAVLARVRARLYNNSPLINGALGHATVLTAMNYVEDTLGQFRVQSLTVRDPWPGSANRRLLSPNEVAGSFLIMGVDIAT